jgi:hypothetical protein
VALHVVGKFVTLEVKRELDSHPAWAFEAWNRV